MRAPSLAGSVVAAGAARGAERPACGGRAYGPRTARIPIVALTALAMKGDEDKALAAGMDAYLSKPIDRAALESLVERFVGSPAGA